MPHAVTVSEATAFFIISTIYHTSLLFYLFTLSFFPLNSYNGIEPTAAFTYWAFLFMPLLILVLLPVEPVPLAIWATMPSAFEALCHSPTWNHSPWRYFHNSFFSTHILLYF